MTAPLPVLVFDLDGTLVDTAADLVMTLNHILRQEGLQPLSAETARPLIGHGARALLMKGLEANSAQVDGKMLDGLTERFLTHYSAHIADHSHIRANLRATLEGFIERGFTLAVCTNKNEALAVQLLKALHLDSYFAAIVGSGRFAFNKPDPRLLLATIVEAGGTGGIMIGDSMTDVDTARAAKLPVIVVDFGYTSVSPHAMGADAVIADWAELPKAVANCLSLSTSIL